MKKLLITLIIATITSLGITANEKFDTVEVNVEAIVSIYKSDTCFVLAPDTIEQKYLSFQVTDGTLRISYAKPYYQELLKQQPVRVNLWMPDTVKLKTTKEYNLKRKTND